MESFEGLELLKFVWFEKHSFYHWVELTRLEEYQFIKSDIPMMTSAHNCPDCFAEHVYSYLRDKQ